jgi:CRISPR/Cas system CMR-associated protein Cmr5 small subunit
MTAPTNESNTTPETTPVEPTTTATPTPASEPATPEATATPAPANVATEPTEVEKAADEASTTSVPPVVAAETATVDPAIAARRAVIWQYAIAIGIVLVMGAGLWYALEQQGRVDTEVFSTLESYVMPEPAAVIVNGEKVTMALYEKNRTQLTAAATQQGLDPATPEVAEQITKQSMDLLINTELLRQAAVKAGVEVTAEDVETRYQELITSVGGEEALLARLTELGLTPEGLRGDIAGELLIQKHLAVAVDQSAIVISDAEIEAFYNSVASSATEPIPPLEEVREEVRAQMTYSKGQELITAYIETLRTSATIEEKL